MLSKKIRIGYISPNNPLDRRASSGTTYYMYKALEQIGAEVVWVQVKRTWVYNIVAVIYKFLSILTKTRILKEYTIVEAILASKSLDRKLIGKCDILFAPFSSVTIFSLETKKPIIYLSDATFALMVDYYLKIYLSGTSVRQTKLSILFCRKYLMLYWLLIGHITR